MSDLRVLPIGVGAAYARVGEIQSAYLVRVADRALCLDLGAGALNALQAHVAPEALDAIVVSHCHPDHCVDLLALHPYMRFGPGRGRRVHVVGPPGLAACLTGFGGSSGWDEAFDFTVVTDGARLEVAGATLTFAAVPHIGATFAVRVERGSRALVYGADCVENGALADLATGSDLLIAECGDGPLENPESPHMSGAGAGRIARAAGVERLLLTHCFPEFDRDATLASARAVFAAAEWAVQGREVVVGEP